MESRWLLLLAAPVLGLGFGLPSAEGAEPSPADCPPGEWFCDDATEPDVHPEAEPEADGSELPDADGVSESVAPKPAPVERRRASRTNERRADPDITVHRPSKPSDDGRVGRRRRLSAWSANVRLQGVMLGGGRRRDDGRMGGVGASLRYAVNPTVTLDFGLDSILGTDYNGYERSEGSLSFSSLLYLNPRHSVRTYAVLGLNTSVAHVDVGGDEQSWSYFGAHAGIGLDIPIDRRVALNLDLLGFVRGRTDERAAREPEFIDDSGRVTNTSGGGLFRAGIALAW